MLYCFLDTNIFIEFKNIAEIDWLTELSCSNVCLVVTSVVVRELDAMKSDYNNKRRRNRAIAARRYLAQIDVKSTNAVKHGVTVQYLHKRPSPTVFENFELSANSNDDILLASALQYMEEHSNLDVMLLTDDLDLQFKARVHDLPEQSLSDESRLKEKADRNEKEIARLSARNRTLESSQPDLKLGFLSSDGAIAKYYKADADFSENLIASHAIEEEKERQRAELEYMPEEPRREQQRNVFLSKLAAMSATQSAIREYYEHLDSYFDELGKYLYEDSLYKLFPDLAIQIPLVIDNSGSAPANGVEIVVTLIGCREILTEAPEKPLYKPEPPAQPKPRSALSSFSDFSPFLHNPYLSMPDIDFGRRPEGWTIEKAGGHRYRCDHYFELVMHHRRRSLDEIFLIIDRPKSFPCALAMEYEVIAQNLIDKVSGELTIIVNEDTE